MPISHAVWTVSNSPIAVPQGLLPSEQMLEDMIVAQPRILSGEWMLIGRQIDTRYGGRIDLLAIAPDGSLVVVELKRDRTPREVVAQALDYAAWVQGLEAEDIGRIYNKFRPGQNLAADFLAQFGQPLDEETINESHQIVIVAAELDASSERIVNYLNDRGLAINVLFFQVFDHGDTQLLSRAWLVDSGEVQVKATGVGRKGGNEPWNGEYYVSFGAGPTRDWEEAGNYRFASGGGGTWYSNSLNMLLEGNPGDNRLWIAVSIGKDFCGRVTAKPFARDLPSLAHPNTPQTASCCRGLDNVKNLDRLCYGLSSKAMQRLGF